MIDELPQAEIDLMLTLIKIESENQPTPDP